VSGLASATAAAEDQWDDDAYAAAAAPLTPIALAVEHRVAEPDLVHELGGHVAEPDRGVGGEAGWGEGESAAVAPDTVAGGVEAVLAAGNIFQGGTGCFSALVYAGPANYGASSVTA